MSFSAGKVNFFDVNSSPEYVEIARVLGGHENRGVFPPTFRCILKKYPLHSKKITSIQHGFFGLIIIHNSYLRKYYS